LLFLISGDFFSLSLLVRREFSDTFLNSFWILDKERELAEAYAEIKASKNAERLAEKAVEEVILTSQCSFLWTWQAP